MLSILKYFSMINIKSNVVNCKTMESVLRSINNTLRKYFLYVNIAMADKKILKKHYVPTIASFLELHMPMHIDIVNLIAFQSDISLQTNRKFIILSIKAS